MGVTMTFCLLSHCQRRTPKSLGGYPVSMTNEPLVVDEAQRMRGSGSTDAHHPHVRRLADETDPLTNCKVESRRCAVETTFAAAATNDDDSDDDTVMPFLVPAAPPAPLAPPLFSPRGARLATRVWTPATAAAAPGAAVRAVCLLVHGLGWHSGYFEGLAGRLNRDGILVVAYDLVGMGYSEAEPGAPAGCIHVMEFGDWVEDVFSAAVWARQHVAKTTTANVPFFLLGESFGGLQVLAAGLDKQQQQLHGVNFAGVVTLGALLQIGPDIRPSKHLVSVMKLLVVCCPRLKLPATDMAETFDEAFGNKEWAVTARKDSFIKVSPQLTLAAAVSIVATGDKVAAQAKQFDIPLLGIHSVRDCRTDCHAVQQFVDQAGGLAEGMWIENTTGHQLLQDHRDVTEAVKNKVAEWIVKQLTMNRC